MITKELQIFEGLCVHCGACGEVCPVSAISMVKDRYGFVTPKLDKSKCILCDQCSNICPVEVERAFTDDGTDKPIYLPEDVSTYEGFSTNAEIRFASSSGGVVKSLIIEFLKNNKNSAVAAVVDNHNDARHPFFDLISDVSEINRIANSKYCPVNIIGILKKIKAKSDAENILFVGLPCQLRAIVNIQNKTDCLKGKNVFYVGLFCKKTKDLRYTNFLINRISKVRTEQESLRKIQFRGKGWPGKVELIYDQSKDEEIFNTSSKCSFPWKWYLFSPLACLFCYDAFARSSDVSVGDPWLPNYLKVKDQKGISLVVAHTSKGDALLKSCRLIQLKPVSVNDVIESQSREELQSKHFNAYARLRFLSLCSNKYPRSIKRKFKILNYINAVWFLSTKQIFDNIFQNRHIAKAPELLFKILTKLPYRLIK